MGVFPFFFSFCSPFGQPFRSKVICLSITKHTGQGVWSVYQSQRDERAMSVGVKTLFLFRFKPILLRKAGMCEKVCG